MSQNYFTYLLLYKLILCYHNTVQYCRSQAAARISIPENDNMIALSLPDTRTITAHLFLKETFDRFCLIEGEITTFNTFHIDGHIHRDFFDTDETAEDTGSEPPAYSRWSSLREHCLNLIRGKRTPLGFRFVFSLSPENIARVTGQSGSAVRPENVQGLYLNFHFDGTSLTCVTGTSFRIFTMDKSLEHIWDEMAQKFFRQHQIPFEIK